MSEQIGAFLIEYSDSSFTNPHEVVRPDEPPECTGNFTHMGAKYWGFETRRHQATSLDQQDDVFHFNDNAFHWLHIGLDQPATIEKIAVSTKWFTGNQVPEISIELIHEHSRQTVLERQTLQPDADATFDITPCLASECIVRCFHEGGIARVNFFGNPEEDEPVVDNLLLNAEVSHVSNEHYGRPMDAVNGNRQVDYMLGWESARTGFGEHALFNLQEKSTINGIIVDTYLHRLNSPLSCHIFGVDTDTIENAWEARPKWRILFDDGHEVIPEDFASYMQQKQYRHEDTASPSSFTIDLINRNPNIWQPVLAFGRLRPDTWHHFKELESRGPFTHLLYLHYPNGGIHGLKVY